MTARRPATLKTGTTNDFRDLQAYGYLAGNPDDPEDPTGAIVTGVWVGNSDFSAIEDVFAADGPTFIWHDYMAEVAALNELPVYDFRRPDGVIEVKIDAMSGMLPGEHTTTTVAEIVRTDVQPSSRTRRTASWPSRPRPARSGRRAAATSRRAAIGLAGSVGRAASARAGPAGLPRPRRLGSGPSGLGGGEPRLARGLDRPRGRAQRLVRVPFPGPLDAPLAPAEECTPGEFPTSTPIAVADPDARRRRRSPTPPRPPCSTPDADAPPSRRSRPRPRRRLPRARRPSRRRRPRPCGRRGSPGRAGAPAAPRAPRGGARRCRCRGR